MRTSQSSILRRRTRRILEWRFLLPLAFTVVVAPAFCEPSAGPDGEVSVPKHKQKGWRTEPKQMDKHSSEGYYESMHVQSQPKELPGDGYYSGVPAWKPPSTDGGTASQTELKDVAPSASPAVSAQSAPASPAAEPSKSLSFDGGVTKVEKPTLASAKAAFNRREFLVALRQFQTLHAQGMCNDTVHYYMARCYQQNAQVVAALQNYEAVISKTKDSRLRAYAETAYEQLERYSQHRTYEGQGNNFQRSAPGPASSGGGGGGGGG